MFLKWTRIYYRYGNMIYVVSLYMCCSFQKMSRFEDVGAYCLVHINEYFIRRFFKNSTQSDKMSHQVQSDLKATWNVFQWTKFQSKRLTVSLFQLLAEGNGNIKNSNKELNYHDKTQAEYWVLPHFDIATNNVVTLNLITEYVKKSKFSKWDISFGCSFRVSLFSLEKVGIYYYRPSHLFCSFWRHF